MRAYNIGVLIVLVLFLTASSMFAQDKQLKPVFGPYHAKAIGSGPGHICWFDGVPPTEPHEAWTITAWVKDNSSFTLPALVAGFGDGLNLSGAERFIATDSAGWVMFFGDYYAVDKKAGVVDPIYGKPLKDDPRGEAQTDSKAPHIGIGRLGFDAPIIANQWIYLAATYNGKEISLYVNGKETLRRPLKLARSAMQVLVGPASPWKTGTSFDGNVAWFNIYNTSLTRAEIEKLTNSQTNLDELAFITAPKGATPEGRNGLYQGRRSAIEPQDDSFMPKPTPSWTPQLKKKIMHQVVSSTEPSGDMVLSKGWELNDATKVTELPEKLSLSGINTEKWFDATVPGTVLTTLVEQGIYPDPLFGLNNLVIPDLSRKTWWYRIEFKAPIDWKNKSVQLTFKGINYHSEVWLNGKSLGNVNGAFIRGVFDVSSVLKYGENNVLAVRVWPQPHNGQGQEESIRSGQGPNGADGCLDGPTFICSEGWDWIPTIRDRNTGIWQDVVLHPTGAVKIGDYKVVTTLPKLPDLSVANVYIETELKNNSKQEQQVTLKGSIEGASFLIPVTLASGETKTVKADPAMFEQLAIQHPKLWWPNGYGEPTLHDFTLKVITADGKESDVLKKRVGLRYVSYDTLPQLCIKINGRRIMAKGGNWGMDDAMKRCSRERLEPYFKLHKNANVNIIRNWVGQSTEDVFYQLCDEYGMMVWNDFWLATVPGDLPAIDADLFMKNAEDVVKRYRTHASIVIWCARNEGDPPTWIASRLDKMLIELDGTREYVPSSWSGRVKGGGPYHYTNGPATYFNIAKQKAFNTELGLNSVPTVDAIKGMLPAALQWPVNDAWSYHDFHTNNNVPGGKYFEAIENSYGQSHNLNDFVKRAQMLNYDCYRAMFEAWNSLLFKPASGVMLWMTHPAQNSMVWQIYSKDFDTHAAYFATKKACEPLHVQWNISDSTISLINNLFKPVAGKVSYTIYDLYGNILSSKERTATANISSATIIEKVDFSMVKDTAAIILKLQWKDNEEKLISENLYWLAAKPSQLQSLNYIPIVKLNGIVKYSHEKDEEIITINLSNPTKNFALMTHLCLYDAKTQLRILPAYISDNYISFLPQDKKTITIRVPKKKAISEMKVVVNGWNVKEIEFK